MKYRGTPNYAHAGSDRVGVLLVNHGSPDGDDPRSVRRYLRDFLADPRLIEMPRWLWLPILHGIVLRTRPGRSARRYRKVWSAEGSPINRISQELLSRLRQSLRDFGGGRLELALGMSYGAPRISAGLRALQAAGCSHILVVPLYPQYSGVTVGSVFDAVGRELRAWRWVPELRIVNGYADDRAYINALAAGVRRHWDERGRGDHLVMSFHSIPQAYAEQGDPYPCYCEKTARLLADALALSPDNYTIAYQSRFGRGKWLQPATEDLLDGWRNAAGQVVDIVCPGFAIDNLETLEEIEHDYAPRFARGGGTLRLIPCLNAGEAHVTCIASLIRRQLSGWESILRAARSVPPLEGASGRIRRA